MNVFTRAAATLFTVTAIASVVAPSAGAATMDDAARAARTATTVTVGAQAPAAAQSVTVMDRHCRRWHRHCRGGWDNGMGRGHDGGHRH